VIAQTVFITVWTSSDTAATVLIRQGACTKVKFVRQLSMLGRVAGCWLAIENVLVARAVPVVVTLTVVTDARYKGALLTNGPPRY
jgi:hypothetical protein